MLSLNSKCLKLHCAAQYKMCGKKCGASPLKVMFHDMSTLKHDGVDPAEQRQAISEITILN